jgi:hypothetical protein
MTSHAVLQQFADMIIMQHAVSTLQHNKYQSVEDSCTVHGAGARRSIMIDSANMLDVLTLDDCSPWATNKRYYNKHVSLPTTILSTVAL